MASKIDSCRKAQDLKERQLRAEKLIKQHWRHVSDLAIISTDPLIFFLPIDIPLFTNDYELLFDLLKTRKVYVLCCTHNYFEKQKHIERLNDTIESYKNRFPDFNFIFLSNTPNQNHLFQEKGLNSVFCNHNCLVDEKIFFPIPDAEKQYDAVYDARFRQWKRHALAANIDSLGLIYLYVTFLEDQTYVDKIKKDFAHAKFYNHSKTGEYKALAPQEINQALNQCRVGLCLSEQEGAMYASIQYLLAGLPIVTTPSVGGRDVFFDDEITITVEPTPEAVKNGVAEMIGRNLDPQYIREKTLERLKPHRQRFISLVQEIYDKESVGRSFVAEFNQIFTNKFVKTVSHQAIIEMLLSQDKQKT